mmetsp:Transcript_17513/g.29511  ORF Transcript_17513/g.29511 Transcript_17513/m.29511 type:complete len:83 (+) Transcript_17513:1636-1884(+)
MGECAISWLQLADIAHQLDELRAKIANFGATYDELVTRRLQAELPDQLASNPPKQEHVWPQKHHSRPGAPSQRVKGAKGPQL